MPPPWVWSSRCVSAPPPDPTARCRAVRASPHPPPLQAVRRVTTPPTGPGSVDRQETRTQCGTPHARPIGPDDLNNYGASPITRREGSFAWHRGRVRGMDLSPNHPPGVSTRLSSASLQNTCGPQARRSPACPARPHTHAPSRGVPGPSRGLPLPPISGAPLRSFARPWRPLRPPRGRMGPRSGVGDVCCHRAWSHGKAAPRAGRRRSRSPR